MAKNIQLLIKPASSCCNENCSYCFYGDEAAKRSVGNRGIMNSETGETFIRRAFEYATDSCDFIFQGGEPLLAGLKFFKNFVDKALAVNAENSACIEDGSNAEESCGKARSLTWSVQTNASLIDDDFANFFKKNNFLVGVSLDGPKEIHDSQRGNGSFDRTMKGIRALQKAGAEFNVLCVVTEESSSHAKEIYEFFKSENFKVQQYIPCLEPLESETGAVQTDRSFSLDENRNYPKADRVHQALSPESWGRFLCEIFDLWEEGIKAGREISVRYFENIARVLLGISPESCGMWGRCSLQFTIESDGSVYPCDFFALDEYLLGNIYQTSFAEMEKSKAAAVFTAPCSTAAKCESCNYYRLCRGGCKRERNTINENIGQDMQTTRLCQGYLMFFEHAVDRLWALLNHH